MFQSPSMSSLTENTTWDSRLLDCSMTRSISPFKFTRGGILNTLSKILNFQAAQWCNAEPWTFTLVGQAFLKQLDQTLAARRRYTENTGELAVPEQIFYTVSGERSFPRGRTLRCGKWPKHLNHLKKCSRTRRGNVKSELKFLEGMKLLSFRTAKSPSSGHKKALFGLLGKAVSLEQQQTAGNTLPPSKLRKQSHGESPVPSEPGIGLPHCSTLPRGGRNPFKGMGSRIVERVRRSLSRSKKSQSRDGTPSLHVSTMTGPPDEPMASSWKWYKESLPYTYTLPC